MRVAALCDVHGNLPALEAVLAEIESEGVDRIVVAGDVLPGPMPGECLDRLLQLSIPVRFLPGNGEHDVLALRAGEEVARVPPAFLEPMRWVARRLSDEQAAAVAAWPATVREEIPGVGSVLFCHATPRDDNEIFTRLTPEERLRPVFGPVDADVVVCGHTHMQFDRRVGDVRVVNAGSVGMPFGEPGAYWALVGPDVELRRSSYDLDVAAERIAGTGYPQQPPFDVYHPQPEAQMLEIFEAAAIR